MVAAVCLSVCLSVCNKVRNSNEWLNSDVPVFFLIPCAALRVLDEILQKLVLLIQEEECVSHTHRLCNN